MSETEGERRRNRSQPLQMRIHDELVEKLDRPARVDIRRQPHRTELSVVPRQPTSACTGTDSAVTSMTPRTRHAPRSAESYAPAVDGTGDGAEHYALTPQILSSSSIRNGLRRTACTSPRCSA